MGQIVTQGLPADLIAAITDTDGVPKTGLTFASVQVQFRREGDNSFTNKTLTSANFVELGYGFYRITFDGSDLSVPGPFAFVAFGTGLQTSQNEAQVRAVGSTVPTRAIALPVCDVTGHIVDGSGNPIEGVAVSARLIGFPTIEGPVALTDDLPTATTDENGVFVLPLIRLSVVEVTISRVNFRRQLTVPNQASADLFTGIP